MSPFTCDGRLDYFQFDAINLLFLKLVRGRTLRVFLNVFCYLINDTVVSSHARFCGHYCWQNVMTLEEV